MEHKVLNDDLKKEKLCVVSSYPYRSDMSYVFVRNLLHEIADLGVECTVISPQSITAHIVRHRTKRPTEWVDVTNKGNRITVYQPRTISFSNFKLFGRSLGSIFGNAAIRRVYKKKKLDPTCLYGHFWNNGISACLLDKSGKVPVVVACGESDITVFGNYSASYIFKQLPKVKGVISVSSANLEECEEKDLLRFNPATVVLPNAINPQEFYKADRVAAREELNIKQDDFVISFIGWFDERKGVLRVVEAARRVPGCKLVLIGQGGALPNDSSIVFSGRVEHNKIVKYLNASDIFVLPTLAEGCCNAIIEAMACGLPVVSSNGSFNDDILDEEVSIRIDPLDVDAIAKAIKKLKDDKNLRERMAAAALKKSEEFHIDRRAEKILRFINNVTGAGAGR